MKANVAISSALGLALMITSVIETQANAIRPGFNASTLPANDDGYTGFVPIGFSLDFFGQDETGFYINNNGNVTFDVPLSTYTPFGITGGTTAMLAPFFADVDTRGVGSPVTYGAGTVGGRSAYGVNWVDVGHYSASPPLNSFQLVVVDRSDIGSGDFDFEFNYDQILWEAGTASGSDSAGLGGSSARVGWTNGAGAYYELPGSGMNGAFLDSGPAGTSLINNSLNSSEDGRYVFRVRNGVVVPPSVPEGGSTIFALSLSLLGLGVGRRLIK